MKIRTDKIEGYKDMSLEQKLEALENFEVEEPDYSGYVTKEMFDKTASELANSKKQLKEKMTADEIKAKEDAESREKLQNDYDELLKKVTISENKAQLLAIGYDDALAAETAEAMANGDLSKVFINQKKHIEAVEKRVRSELTKKTPKADGGNSDIGITKEALLKMSSGDRYKFSQEHPDEYKKLYGGNE